MITDRIADGDVRAAARMMRMVDDRMTGYQDMMKDVYTRSTGARIIGITGAPGAGKSTLTDALITALRKKGRTVGVVAIDPTSPFTGGAILGDRIRMAGHAADDDVFIRSVATRGSLGGLSASAMDIAAVMDAMGKDEIIIETVGVGQDEVDIAGMADSTVVVSVPGLGDDIQAIKAGILEVADVFVVNKADRDGADATVRDLEMMLDMSGRASADAWVPPVVSTVAVSGKGIDDLLAAIESHREASAGDAASKRKRGRLRLLAYGHIRDRLMREVFPDEEILTEIDNGASDPYTIVERLWARLRP